MTERRFGSEALPGGGVRFRLWAPSAARVDLQLGRGDEQRMLPMAPDGDGWFVRSVDDAGAGAEYLFLVNGGQRVPDPASRQQVDDVHGAARVQPAETFSWSESTWRGRPWEETVLYEIHTGTFTAAGGFDGVRQKLDHLRSLGVTALQLMPIADFPGKRNWGYDGVLPFAPDAAYGEPDDLRRLVDAAHARSLMVFLDVVYNHFGPEGNYLHLYARDFFDETRRTPWGDAINFDGPRSRTVRDFFIENALLWLEEFRFDGLRLDAVHAIHDDSTPGFLDDLATAVRAGPAAQRHVHLVLENDDNQAHLLDPGSRGYTAQWNDDFHHALHCLLTGETSGYYADYADEPARHLARALAEGFSYQGQASRHRGGRPRGEPSAHLAPTAFVSFLQNHDQIGNRALGERLSTLAGERELRAAVATMLLAPAPPMLFMGEEFGCRQPFPFFCDFGPELARAVSEGRRREFQRFEEFHDPETLERLPEPSDPATFRSAVLDWSATEDGNGLGWLDFYRSLLDLRRRQIVPRLAGCRGELASWRLAGPRAMAVEWVLGDRSKLGLLANLGDDTLASGSWPVGEPLFIVVDGIVEQAPPSTPGPWTCAWFLDDRQAR